MNAKLFISTTGKGIARAERNGLDKWTVTTALEDRDVRCLAADPLDPKRVYAGTQGDGILRSDDRGLSWRPVGMAGQVVKSIAASPHQPGLIYAGGKPPAVFVSEDCGESWVELGAFRGMRRWYWVTPAEPGAPYVQAITLSPSEPGVILAGVELGAVLRSEDGGETWSDHRRDPGLPHADLPRLGWLVGLPGRRGRLSLQRRRRADLAALEGAKPALWLGLRRRPGPAGGALCLGRAWPV
jgi:photosystem II stability/assembly factor-like uncharacterized protein